MKKSEVFVSFICFNYYYLRVILHDILKDVNIVVLHKSRSHEMSTFLYWLFGEAIMAFVILTQDR